MTPEDLAAIHAAAMSVPKAWDAATFQGFLSSPATILTTKQIAPPLASPEVRGRSAPSHTPESTSGSMEVRGGFALGRVIVDEAELLTMAVSPTVQGQGLGRACLREFLAECAMRGAGRVFLEVAETNKTAQKLYASEGFAEVSRRSAYYRQSDGTRTDAFLMRRAQPGEA